MFQLRRNQRGSTSLAEYAVTIFLVIGTITAMTTYVQRTLQARMRDARHYMTKTVNDKCDLYCGQAAGLTTWKINLAGAGFDNTQCDNMTNLACVDERQYIYQNRVGDQYEPYYAQVITNVESERERNKMLMEANNKSGIFMDRRESVVNAETISNQAAPGLARTKQDQVLVATGD